MDLIQFIETSLSLSLDSFLYRRLVKITGVIKREREYWNTLYYAECVTCIVISRSTDFTITLLECIALEYNLGEVSKRARVYYEFSD